MGQEIWNDQPTLLQQGINSMSRLKDTDFVARQPTLQW